MFVAGGADSEADRIVVETALANYTRDAAYASFEENVKGTISAGKYADFVVLSQDILRIPPAELLGTRVLLTVMGGQETHRACGAAGESVPTSLETCAIFPPSNAGK